MDARRLFGRLALLVILLATQPYATAQMSLPGSSPSGSAASDPAVLLSTEDLLHAAVEAIGANHLAQAHTLLDRVRQLDPKQPGLWSAYGMLSLRENDASAAVVAFRKELADHPDALQVYAPLVSTLLGLKRRPEALDTLRAWSAAAPTDPRPIGLLVGILLDDGQTSEAIQAGTDGLARLPETARNDLQLQYALASAELKGGDKASGARRMTALLQLTDDASVRNSIAYALADAGMELPTAEATERAVLNQLELESEGWSLDGNPQIPLFGTQLLAAAWDTMGWILFKESKLAEAEPFVRTSLRNNPHADVAAHLSAIAAARGQGSAAIASASTNAALLRLRTFPLGLSGGRNGSGNYRILLSRGKVIHAHHDSGDLNGPALDALFSHADLSALFPAGRSYVQLVHRATVNCTGKACEMVLAP